MPEKSKEYQKLLDKRENAIRALKFHENKIAAITDEQQLEALSRLNAIENAYEKFTAACDSIENLDEFIYSDLTIPNEDIVDLYITSSAKLKLISKDLLESSLLNSTTHSRPSTTAFEVKLPQLQIPTFSGEYEEWNAFYDAFTSLVDTNIGLSDVNKMHYLRSSLKGTALKSISRLPVTDANYKIAIKTLLERFQNKRVIINSCLKTFISQSEMKTRNSFEIRSLIDTTKESLQCIDTLNVPIDEWSPFIVFIVQTKMDEKTRVEWEDYLGGATEIPKYNILMKFLETQFRILEGSNDNRNENEQVNNIQQVTLTNTNNQQRQNKTQANQNTNFQSNKNEKCKLCSENHWILQCSQFLDWTPIQRKNYALQNNICIVCLHSHEKGQCRSKYKCKKCNGAHSFRLHVDDDAVPNTSNISTAPIYAAIQNDSKIFATALVKVLDKFGSNHLLRVFIDMGSGGALISERAAQLLCLPRKRENTPLTGIDNMSLGNSTNSVRIQVKSMVDDAFQLNINTHVMRTIINPKKFNESMASNWKHLNNIELADPQYLNPTHIDLLFGVDIYGLIIKNGIRKGLAHEPVAQN